MLKISMLHYLMLSGWLFSLGAFGIFWHRRNLLLALLSIEIMLLAVNINFVTFARHLDDIVGQIFVIFVFAIAAAETAIGLAIFVVFFRCQSILSITKPVLKG